MRLFEFDGDPELNIKLTVAADKLKSILDAGKLDSGMTTNQLLDFFNKYDLIIDVEDLYSMYSLPPLNKVIANINDDNVVFKGQDDSLDPNKESEQEKTVEKMAKSALKK